MRLSRDVVGVAALVAGEVPRALALAHTLELGIIGGPGDIEGGAVLVAGEVPRALAHPLELRILRDFLATSKVMPPLSLAKSHELLLSLLRWGFY